MNGLLTNRQISLVLFAALFGYGIINLPSNVAKAAGRGGWITILMTIAIFMVITYMVAYIQYTHENKTLYDYTEELLGRFIAILFTLSYGVYFFMAFTMIARLYIETVKINFLPTTPTWALLLLYFGTVLFLLSNNLRAVGRLSEIYIPAAIIIYIVIIMIIFTHGEIVNMRPFIERSQIDTYFKAIKEVALPFLGMEVLLVIPFSKKSNKKIFKYLISTIALVGLLYLLLFEASVSVKGIDSMVGYKNTLIEIIRGNDIPYLDFFRRGDGFFFIFWTGNMFCSTSIWAYGSTACFNKIFVNKKYALVTIFVIIIGFIVSLIPNSVQQAETILNFVTQLSPIYLGVIPIIILIATKVKK